MENLVSAIRTLGARKSALEAELAKINEELQEITAELEAAKDGRTAGAAAAEQPAVVAEAKPPAPKAPKKTPAKKPAQRSWFQPGEAVALFQKVLKNPTSPSEAVNEVVALKGHRNLPKADLERFKWAALSALKAAVANKTLVRRDGKVALPSARKFSKSKSKGARA